MDTKSILDQLSAIYRTQDMKRAEEFLDQHITLCRQVQDKATLLSLLNELMGLYRVTGRAADAKSLSDEALVAVDDLGLSGSIQHGITLLNSATALRAAGNHDEALPLFQKAEDIFKENKEGNDIYLSSLYNNMSQLYLDRKDYESALTYQKEALELVQEQVKSLSKTATAQVNISYTYMALERLDEAEAMLEAAMEYYDTERGQKDPHHNAALSALGQLVFMQGRYELAVERFTQALEREKELYGESDAWRMMCKNLEVAKTKAAQCKRNLS